MTKNSLRAEQFVADDQGTDGVVAGASTGIADDVGIAFGQSGEFCGIEAGVHAGENGETAGGRDSEFALFAEVGGVFCVCFQDFLENVAHCVLLEFLNWAIRPILASF